MFSGRVFLLVPPASAPRSGRASLRLRAAIGEALGEPRRAPHPRSASPAPPPLRPSPRAGLLRSLGAGGEPGAARAAAPAGHLAEPAPDSVRNMEISRTLVFLQHLCA